MKTIVHYRRNSYLRTTENWIYNQIKYIKKYDPIVFCHGICNRNIFPLEQIRNLNIRRNPSSALWEKFVNKFYYLFPLLCAIWQDHPDIVHAHFGPAGYTLIPFKKMFGFSMITTFYGYDLSSLPIRKPYWKQRYHVLFKEGDLFLVEGVFMKSCLVKMGCSEKKIIVQHLGVDLDKIHFEPRSLKFGEDIKILISASFREKKGIPYAIEAVALFKQRCPHMKVRVTVIGDSSGQLGEEQEKARILAVVKEQGLKSEVKFLGYQPHAIFINELYKNHIFLSPSVTASDGDTEGGSPVSIIEASASGMPVLSTTHCDIPEVIINGLTGFLVPERDVHALAEKLEFLVKNFENWKEMGQKAREHIEMEYSVSKQSMQLEAIYDQILE